MDRKKQSKKQGLLSSRFYRIYFAVVAVAVVAIAIGLMWLRGAVADYEIASITETAIMDVFPADLSETRADREARQKAQNKEQ